MNYNFLLKNEHTKYGIQLNSTLRIRITTSSARVNILIVLIFCSQSILTKHLNKYIHSSKSNSSFLAFHCLNPTWMRTRRKLFLKKKKKSSLAHTHWRVKYFLTCITIISPNHKYLFLIPYLNSTHLWEVSIANIKQIHTQICFLSFLFLNPISKTSPKRVTSQSQIARF